MAKLATPNELTLYPSAINSSDADMRIHLIWQDHLQIMTEIQGEKELNEDCYSRHTLLPLSYEQFENVKEKRETCYGKYLKKWK
jgi:hypothetical protein